MLVNLKRTRRATGKSQEVVAEELQVPLGTYRAWEQLKSTPRGRELNMLGDYFCVAVDELMGRADILPTNAINAVAINSLAPVYGCIPAGTPLESDECREEDLWVNPDVLAKHPHGFYLHLSGDSMNLRYPDGCYVFVDPEIIPVSGDVGAVWVNGNDATVKRLHITKTAITLLPESTNPEHKPLTIFTLEDDAPEVKSIGKVVWFTVRYDGSG